MVLSSSHIHSLMVIPSAVPQEYTEHAFSPASVCRISDPTYVLEETRSEPHADDESVTPNEPTTSPNMYSVTSTEWSICM